MQMKTKESKELMQESREHYEKSLQQQQVLQQIRDENKAKVLSIIHLL